MMISNFFFKKRRRKQKNDLILTQSAFTTIQLSVIAKSYALLPL